MTAARAELHSRCVFPSLLTSTQGAEVGDSWMPKRRRSMWSKADDEGSSSAATPKSSAEPKAWKPTRRGGASWKRHKAALEKALAQREEISDHEGEKEKKQASSCLRKPSPPKNFFRRGREETLQCHQKALS